MLGKNNLNDDNAWRKHETTFQRKHSCKKNTS